MKNKKNSSVEKQKKNEEILGLALKAFAKKGFGGVTINALAKEANVADSLLHYHFKSKKELWQKTLSFIGNKIGNELDQLMPLIRDLEGVQQLKVLNRKIVHISAQYPEFQQIVVQEVFSKSERSKWLIDELLTPIFSHHGMISRQEQEKGTIKKVPQANLVSFMIGGITTFFARSYQMETMFGVNPFDEEQVEQHADIINDLIFDGLLVR